MSLRQQPITIYQKMQILPGLTGLYLHILLRDIARGLESVFVPLYVYKLTGSMVWPFLFYALYHLMVVVGACWLPNIVSRIGIDWSAAAGAILRAFSLMFFILASYHMLFLWPAFIVWGILIIFTWVPHHYTIIKSIEKEYEPGQKSSLVLICQHIASAITPLVGGLIVWWFGFRNLYLASIVFVLLSALPMFFDRIEKKDMRFDIRRIMKDIINPDNRRINTALVGEGLEGSATLVLWPLFMFLYIGQVHRVGLVTTAALLISLAALYWLGKYSDQKGKKWSQRLFGLLAVIWVIRPFFHSMAKFIVIDTAYYISLALVFLAYNSSLYVQAVRQHRMEFLVRREVLYHGGALIGSLIMAVGVWRGWWLIGFWLAALGAWWMKKAVFMKAGNKV